MTCHDLGHDLTHYVYLPTNEMVRTCIYYQHIATFGDIQFIAKFK